MKLKLGEKILYGFGDFGSQLAYGLITTYLLMFLTDVVGISPTAGGVLIMVALIFDAVNDVVIGTIADKRKSKGKKYSSFTKAACVPYGIFLVLCFISPGTSDMLHLVWAYVIYLLYTVISTMFQVPYGAAANYITTEPDERIKLGSFRDWGANLAGFLLNLFAVNIITGFSKDGLMDRYGFLALAIIIGIMTIVFTLISSFSIKERVPYTATEEPSFKESIKSLGKNRPAICLTLMVFCINLFISFKQVFTTYYGLYVVGDENSITLILVIMFTLPLIGLLFVPKLCRVLGNRMMFILSGVFAIISGGLTLIGGQNTVVMIISAIFGGLTVSGVYANVWGCMPNAADYGEWKTGVKATGLIYSMSTFAIKLSVAITSLLSGIILTAVHYDASVFEQSAETVSGIGTWYGIFPVIAGILGILCILPYNLDKKTMDQVEHALHSSGESK